MAGQVLPQFQEHPDAWQRVPAILQQSNSTQTKVSIFNVGEVNQSSSELIPLQYIALQILDKLIATRWKVLPADQQQGEH
jgi:exportin-1